MLHARFPSGMRRVQTSNLQALLLTPILISILTGLPMRFQEYPSCILINNIYSNLLL